MIPHKSVERLILYRDILDKLGGDNKANVYSKELAELSGCSAAQVRRDLMFVGYSGNPQNGYTVKDLSENIRTLLAAEKGINIAVIGVGNLGRAILGYFNALAPKFKVVAAFERDTEKAGRVIAGCRCYDIHEASVILKEKDVHFGVITVPASEAQSAADTLVVAGIKGIVNFAPQPVKVPEGVFVENMDIGRTFEKVAYMVRTSK